MVVFRNVLPLNYIEEINNMELDFHETWQNGIDSIKQWIHVCKKQKDEKSFIKFKEAIDYFEKNTGIKVKDIHRCKVNIINPMTVDNITLERMIHIDTDYDPKVNYNSLVCYLNDIDGDTVFFDDSKNEIFRCTPKKGDVVFFKSHIFHRATPPSQGDRKVINFMLETE